MLDPTNEDACFKRLETLKLTRRLKFENAIKLEEKNVVEQCLEIIAKGNTSTTTIISPRKAHVNMHIRTYRWMCG